MQYVSIVQKEKKTLYERLPPKSIEERKPGDTVHIDMIVPYIKYIRQQQPVIVIIKNNGIITCMMTIDPQYFEVPTFDLNEVMGGNDK